MTASWHDLVGNLAMVALFAAIWLQLADWLDDQLWPVRKLTLGALTGLGSIGTMFMAVEVVPGIQFDLRSAVLSVGAFFGGPIVAVTSAALAMAFRLIEGGAGLWAGIPHVAGATLIGLGMRWIAGTANPQPLWIVNLGLGIAGLVLATGFFLRPVVAAPILAEFMPATALLAFIATVGIGLAIRKARIAVRETRILDAALAQTPEFLYVKDTASRFVAANHAVARHKGFASPRAMIGLTEFEIAPGDHAEALFDEEQQIIRTGEPILDREEEVTNARGDHRWFRTSKVPVRDRDGRIIGLAGVTVDTTDLKQLENELTVSRDRLALALTEMSDGLAVFDSEGYLLFCNDQYRTAFPLTAHTRVPGAHITDILLECARSGEQVDIPRDDVQGWAERVGSLLRVPNVVTIELYDGRFVQLRNSTGRDDTAVVIVSDITEIKQAEQALIAANADLSRQAATDALTGLPNRRVFDETLVRDMARCGRVGTQLSLIIIDVDHFKRYNDTHGHLEGDKCLVIIANSIKASLHRPADLAARYGGEEFAVILPDTDLEGAIAVAERLRQSITATSMVHIGSIGSTITASFGVAEYDLAKCPATPEDLIGRADAALYAAKAGGRDRVAADDTEAEIKLRAEC